MAVSKDNARIPITLKKTLKEELTKIAKEENRTFSNLVEKILEDWYKEHKDNLK